MAPRRVVVVGASLAGLSVAESLRSEGYDGSITVIGAETRQPYDRPPLSKQILAGEWEPERAALRSPEELERLAVDWRLGSRATALDLAGGAVRLAGGETVGFDRLCVATGAAPRRLPGAPDMDGVHVLRTLDDCLALRARLEQRPRVVVVGAGFIGLEIAAVARTRGLDVTVVEMAGSVLPQALGAAMGELVARPHREAGVVFRLGVAVEALEGGDRVRALRLSDGSSIEADLVVVGIGVAPVTDWLEDSGLELDDGVVCDEFCRAAPDVFAAGDVARWNNRRFGRSMRVEHWTNAVEQGMAVAANLLAPDESALTPYQPVPSFWSDQYDSTIMYAGVAGPSDDWRLVHGTPGERRVVALAGREGRLVGVLAFNWPRRYREYEGLIGAAASVDEALARAAELETAG